VQELNHEIRGNYGTFSMMSGRGILHDGIIDID